MSDSERPTGSGSALFASEERFHRLVDAISDYAIYMLDATGHVATWNPGAEKTKGYQAHEIIGQHFSTFYTPEDRAAGKPEQVLEQVRREGRFEEENWRVRRDGTRFWASVVITALRDETGRIVGFAKVTRDLTAKRAAEAELHAAEQRFHHLVDAVSDYAIYMLDADGRVQTWNAGAQKTKGYEAQEIIGKHFSAFYTPEDRASGKPAMVLEQVRRVGRFEEENWRIRKDGSRFWASVIITALRDEAGQIIGFAKVTRDLTAKRAAEESRKALLREQLAREGAEFARAELERVSRAKDEFLATMSHELRTPLNAIAGWATILRKKPLDASKLERGLEAIQRNAQTQERLVGDLLDVSRIISGKLHLVLVKTDVRPAIVAAAEVVRPAAEAKGVRLIVDVDPEIGSTLADADRIQQMVWNLLANAVRFTPRGGRVTVSGDRVGSDVKISVRDTGAGIAAEHLAVVFERFRQLDSSTTRAHSGLGLGLSIVRYLAEAHGGSVEAHSEGMGLGASFTILLPIQAVDDVRPAAPPEGQSVDEEAPNDGRAGAHSASLARVRVLAVDDNQDSLDVLREVLEGAGAHVRAVRSADEALEALETEAAFDVLVSDISMPGTDGYTLIERIRNREKGNDLPAIALTAYARATDADRARRAGYQEHLAKPVGQQQLLSAVASLVRVGPQPHDPSRRPPS